jgi:hypothetical protein
MVSFDVFDMYGVLWLFYQFVKFALIQDESVILKKIIVKWKKLKDYTSNFFVIDLLWQLNGKKSWSVVVRSQNLFFVFKKVDFLI